MAAARKKRSRRSAARPSSPAPRRTGSSARAWLWGGTGVLLAAAAWFAWGAGPRTAGPGVPPNGGLPTTPQYLAETVGLRIGDRALTAEVARTDMEWRRGLMHRPPLADDRAMLFVYPGRAPRFFYMRNTPSPLSVAYLADDGSVLEIHDMTPMSEKHVPSRDPVRLALEVRQGLLAEWGVRPGDRVVWDRDIFAPREAAAGPVDGTRGRP